MQLPLVLGLLATLGQPQGAPPVPETPPTSQVYGVIRVVQGERRGPLPFAFVEVVGTQGRRAVMADTSGFYRIEGVRAGRHRIRASHVGYESFEVEVLVPADHAVEVDLVLRSRTVKLPALRALAEPLMVVQTDSGGGRPHTRAAGLVNLRSLEASPGLAESGLGEAVRSLPGNEPRDPSDVLLMRGSTADLKLVLLDGAPVYAPFHTGGLLQGFQVSTLGAAAHHVGGAPARYDGGLSYILDLRTRTARRDRLRAQAAVDLMSVQGGVEMPLGERVGLLATGRSLHHAGGRLAGGEGSPYGYSDVLARLDVDVGPEGRLAVTGFSNREAVHLEMPASMTTPGLDAASWGNDAVTARWSGPVGGTGSFDLGVASTAYDAELPVTVGATSLDDDEAEDPPVHVASGTTERTRVTADVHLPNVAHGLRFGGSFDHTRVAYGTRSAGEGSSFTESRGGVMGAYVDGMQPLLSELDLRYGMRVDQFDPGGLKAALRLAVLWNLGPDALLTVAGGRYHQLVRLGDTEADLALGDALEVGTVPTVAGVRSALLQAATADHLTVSLDQLVTPEVRLAFEGFVKRFRGLGSPDAPELASSGADLQIVREGRSTTAWVGYSLAWFWEVGETPSEFSGRHLLSAGLQGQVTGPVGVDLRASFSDGLPLTAVVFDDVSPGSLSPSSAQAVSAPPAREVEAVEADGFLRVDVEVFADWTRQWGGRTMGIRPYLKVINALDRRDALFYYFEPWRSEGLRPLAELTFIPIAGIEWRF